MFWPLTGNHHFFWAQHFSNVINKLGTAQGHYTGGLKNPDVIEKLKKPGTFYQGRKDLRLIIHVFKCFSCHHEAEEVELVGELQGAEV